jgi:hypothetical protein
MRSAFLIHWSGRQFDDDRDPTSVAPALRRRYTELLHSIIERGLYLSKPDAFEAVTGHQGGEYKYIVSMICFTEIRLSQAISHASEYGLLGIGFDRDFVLQRCGAPVFYVRSAEPESIVGSLCDVRGWLQQLEVQFAAHGKRDDQTRAAVVKTELDHAMSFLKPMSKPGCKSSCDSQHETFDWLEELEWRIVYNHVAEDAGLIASNESGTSPFRLPLLPDDIRVLVFPDADTRRMARADPLIHTFIGQAVDPPIMLTLAECEQF